jgi:hypothetical protein
MKVSLSRDELASGMGEAFEAVFPRWLGCRDDESRQTISEAIGKLAYALNLPTFAIVMPRIVQYYLSQLRKESASAQLSIANVRESVYLLLKLN